ncbi:MAG: hypothetical protein ACPHRO_02620 [Nannocystaceae bacterium]
MTIMSPRRRRLSRSFATLSVLAVSCQEAPRPDGWSESEVVSELPATDYLAVVSVTLSEEEVAEPTALHAGAASISSVGTFVEYAGGTEDHVRMLSGIPRHPTQRFSSGTCVRADSLIQPASPEGDGLVPAEVMLLDVGNIHLQAGPQRVPFDLVLVPDLPPLFAGISYRQRTTPLPAGSVAPDGSIRASVHIDALSDSDLSAISEPINFPPYIGLMAAYDRDTATLHARWQGRGSTPMELELGFEAADGGEIRVLCVVEDSSRLTLALDDLEALELPASPPTHVVARRIAASTRASGVFDAIDFQAIRSSRTLLSPPLL